MNITKHHIRNTEDNIEPELTTGLEALSEEPAPTSAIKSRYTLAIPDDSDTTSDFDLDEEFDLYVSDDDFDSPYTG